MVIKFTLPEILPQDLEKAVLSLYAVKIYDEPHVDEKEQNGLKELYQLSTQWDSKVQWNRPWKTAGGDFLAATKISYNDNAVSKWENFDVTAIVKSQLGNGGANNCGFIIRYTQYKPPNAIVYAATKYSNTSLRPKLELTYKGNPTNIHESKLVATKNELQTKYRSNRYIFSMANTNTFSLDIYSLSGKLIASQSTVNGKIEFPCSIQNMFVVKVKTHQKTLTAIVSPLM